MALQYQTGSATDVEDLVNKIQTFLGSNGFTIEEYSAVNNRCTISDGSSLYVTLAWDSTDQQAIAVFQSLGWTAGDTPGTSTDDSGNGDTVLGTIDDERRAEFQQAGPYTAYHLFVEDGATGDEKYCHIVVEVTSGIFVHFGFGNLVKVGTWTGGEYAYGGIWSQASISIIDVPSSPSHSMLLDSNVSTLDEGATMHMEGVGDQGVSEKWGIFYTSTSGGTDTAGETRRVLYGSSRQAGFHLQIQNIRQEALASYVPISPVVVAYFDQTISPDKIIWLGQMPNVGILNLGSLSPGDDITLGGETWTVFPWARKQFLQNDTIESWNAGVAYRKS